MEPADPPRPLDAFREALGRAAKLIEPVSARLPESFGGSNPAARLASTLLERSMLQTSAQAELDLAESLLLQLVPDELRILTLLAREGWTPAVDVESRTGDPTRSLYSATLLGRNAAIALTDHAHFYVARLRSFGLVREAPLQPGHDAEFEILLAEPAVLRAGKTGRGGLRGPRVRRYGVELSPVGAIVMRVASSSP